MWVEEREERLKIKERLGRIRERGEVEMTGTKGWIRKQKGKR